MNLKEQLKSLNKDYELRSYLFSGFSLFTTFVFLIYNLVLGIVYSAIWNFSISFYYLILLTLRTIIITKKKTWRYDEISIRNKKRLKLFRFTTKILLVMDLALIIPISLMVLSKRNVDISMIPTIGIAAYTTYKVTFCNNQLLQNSRTKKSVIIWIEDNKFKRCNSFNTDLAEYNGYGIW